MTSEERTQEVQTISRRAFAMATQVAEDPSQRVVLTGEARSLGERLLALAGELDTDPPAAERVQRQVSESILDLDFVQRPTEITSLRLGSHLHATRNR